MRRVRGLARRSLACLAALCALAPGTVRADTALVASDPLISGPFETPPRLEMRRTGQPPRIDGKLTDPVWSDAPGFRGMVTTEPLENGTPTEETVIRLLYDSDFLYVGVRCFDREPDKIKAGSQTPDDFMLQDDVIGFFIDSFGEGRSGYNFSTNPLGNRSEALVEINRTEFEWDGIWHVRSRIDELGWTAEIRIPFKTISFNPQAGEWGFQFVREVRRKNEKQRLMYGSPSRRNFDLADLPRLVGMRDLEQGEGLTVKPSTALRYRRERASQRRYLADTPSLDLFYRLTPALTSALTFNTDFSETPVDTRQLNLTRFAAFFPEQRDFFLEDAGIFDFGGLAKEPGVGARDTPMPIAFALNGMPFFSRSIGIAPDGENVDLEAGAKLTGRVGHVNVGLLTVRTDSHGVYDPVPAPPDSHNRLDGTQLSVGRVSLNVLEESRIGLIATQGDPAFNRDASTLGFDFNYRSSRIFGDQILVGSLWALDTGRESIGAQETARGGITGTEPDGGGSRGGAFGARLEYPNDHVNWKLSARELQENYRPALGFANRTGIRQYSSVFRYRTRSEGIDNPIHWFDVGWDAWLVTDVDNHLESSEAGLRILDIADRMDDRLVLRWIASEERLDEPFEIFPGVVIPVGDYPFTRGEVSVISRDVHPLSGRLLVSYGDFYSGKRFETDARLIWRPSRTYQLELDWIQADVRLPPESGDFTSRVLRGRVLIMFSTRLSWDTVVQYDNISDSMGMNSRLRWELEPGNELFLVFNSGYNAQVREDGSLEESRLRSSSAELIGKIEWTFRF
jgi:hypothetical protein